MKGLRAFCAAAVLFCVFASPCVAAEQIISFQQQLAIEKNSDVRVVEKITVNVENIEILHGIKRFFPTERSDAQGRARPIGFEVERVLLDGEPVQYSTDYGSDRAVVKIGSGDAVIPRGRHIFTICYRTKGQIGFFDDHDELYWNVTGNGWKFPILSAACEIRLPEKAFGEGFEDVAWYTGAYGSTDTTGAEFTGTGGVKTTRALAEGEGLTVVYGWKKGIVEEPPLPALDDPVTHSAAGIFVFAAMLVWLIFAWRKWGKDPKITVIPLFHAPDAVSPAALAYADTLKFESKTLLASNIIDIAVKGLLTIEQSGGERKLLFKTPVSYTLRKKEGDAGKLTPDEAKMYRQLFGSADTLLLSNDSADILLSAQTVAKSSCKALLGKLYETNGKVFSVAALIYAVGVALLWFNSGEEFPVDMFLCGLAGFATFALNLKLDASPACVKFRSFAARIAAQAIITLFGAFLALTLGNNPLPFFIYSASLCAISVFRPIISARNERGAELFAAAEGLKLYMTTAEKERLELLNPPEETPQLFEKLLPYAFALGVAETWADRFSEQFKTMEYKPQWYHGGTVLWLPHDFSRSFGDSVTTAAAPRAQNFGGDWGSGFGGGFSGGGGGGGGGSGW